MSTVNSEYVTLNDPMHDVQGQYRGPRWAIRQGWKLREPTRKEREPLRRSRGL